MLRRSGGRRGRLAAAAPRKGRQKKRALAGASCRFGLLSFVE